MSTNPVIMAAGIGSLSAAFAGIGSSFAGENMGAVHGTIQALNTPDTFQKLERLQGGDSMRLLIERMSASQARELKSSEVATLLALSNMAFERMRGGHAVPRIRMPYATRAALHGAAAPYVDSSRGLVPRDYQEEVVRAALKHYMEHKRGGYRMDTGDGKTPTFAFIIKALMKKDRDTFGNMPFILGSHQREAAEQVANTMRKMFPNEKVVFLDEGFKTSDLQGAKFVVGTYQQLAQEGTSATLREWIGARKAFFILDETDMVAYKGDREDKERSTAWVQFLVDFGLFRKSEGAGKFRYDGRTRHYLMGASATLDRPDGIPMSVILGPGNIFWHRPMAEGIRRGSSVPVVGYIQEMDIPPEEEHLFQGSFVSVDKKGKYVVDRERVRLASSGDFAVKTAVRAALDHMHMQIFRRQGTIDTGYGIGFARDVTALEKHIRWQRDIFFLVEMVYFIGLALDGSAEADEITELLGGKRALGTEEEPGLLAVELERFLYSWEWKEIRPMCERALKSLRAGRRDGVRALFERLYTLLHVEIRKFRDRPLVASGVWGDMNYDKDGRKVPHGSQPSEYLNQFGDRAATFKAQKDGRIDMTWSVGMLGRGFDNRLISFAIDNAPTRSRRLLVQRVGRIMRPPNPLNLNDHSLKPDAHYVTVTTNLEAHQVDMDIQDIERAYGVQMDMDLGFVRIDEKTPVSSVWATSDPPQLELSGEKKVHLVLVGANMRRALREFLRKRNVAIYGKEELDPEILAFDAGMRDSDYVSRLLMGVELPREQRRLRRLLENWGAKPKEAEHVIGQYIMDRAAMRTIYGTGWRVVNN